MFKKTEQAITLPLPSTKSGLDNYLFFPSTNKWQFHIAFEELEGKEELAWNSSDCFESFSALNNVWIDGPLMLSSDVTHYPKTG